MMIAVILYWILVGIVCVSTGYLYESGSWQQYTLIAVGTFIGVWASLIDKQPRS